MPVHGSVAAKVRAHKAANPSDYCPVDGCLWRIKTAAPHTENPCRHHAPRIAPLDIDHREFVKATLDGSIGDLDLPTRFVGKADLALYAQVKAALERKVGRSLTTGEDAQLELAYIIDFNRRVQVDALARQETA